MKKSQGKGKREINTTSIVHKLPLDLKKAIENNVKAQEIWNSITPLAHNEWICWILSAKKDETRERRIKTGINKMKKGIRRPCCWIGCIHRRDKKISPSVQYVLNKK